MHPLFYISFFFNSPATSEIYTLSLHDALPIFYLGVGCFFGRTLRCLGGPFGREQDRKSTRLNSSHVAISYAVFCLKKKINMTGIGLIIRYNNFSALMNCLLMSVSAA